ncbi:MAG: acyloxyacyl hydrolase [Phycisphaerae bacterium]|nr:acyloxyacyl hydrolase [Phycisphaerae bacterium]
MFRRKHGFLLLVVIAGSLNPLPARAEQPLLNLGEAVVDKAVGMLNLHPSMLFETEGEWRRDVYGGFIEELRSDETLYFVAYSVERMVRDDFASVVEFVGYSVDQHQPGARDSLGGGLNLLGRWYFDQEGDVTWFGEGGVGASMFNYRTPGPLGTHFNFNAMGGAGLRWKVSEQTDLIAAGRYYHLSNANKDGSVFRNPSIDGFGAYAGLSIRF